MIIADFASASLPFVFTLMFIALIVGPVFFIKWLLRLNQETQERVRAYREWYNTLTFEQKQIEDIRRNTANQEMELQRLRSLLEDEQRRNRM